MSFEPGIGDRQRSGRGRRIFDSIVGLLLIAVAAAVAGYVLLATAYMPLTAQGVTADLTPHSLWVRTENGGQDPSRPDGLTYEYCGQADGRFALELTIKNNGWLPVTIDGADPGPGGPVNSPTNNTFALVDFAAVAPGSGDLDGPDPLKASALGPVSLGSGESIEVWARYQIASHPLGGNRLDWTSTIWIRYSVLGVSRTAQTPLGGAVAILGNCD
jgi:hypothetical protein